MEDSTRIWLEKIERDLRELHTDFTRTSAESSTKLDFFIKTLEGFGSRIRDLEIFMNKQEGINDESGRKVHQMTLGVLAATAVIVGLGVWLSYIVNH